MKRLLNSILLALIFIVVTDSVSIAKKRESAPNIIFILADDLGYGDLSCYGSERINTPNIDNLASSGIKFDQFYAGCAVCTPTRASIIGGKFPLRFNIETHFNDVEMHLQPNIYTIPKALHQAGYISMHIGKWHLGGLNEAHVKDRANSMPGPIEHGFDHYLTMLEDPLYRKPAMLEDRLYRDAGKSLVRDDKVQEPIEGHWTDIKTDAAIDFLEFASEDDKPLFLNLWYDAPHAPYEATPEQSMAEYRDRTRGKDLLYRGMVTHLDYSIGRLIKRVKELGLYNNTIIIFTSDNGPAYLGSPGPFKGRKVDMHEGGIRVPMIAVWDRHIKSGTVSNEVAHTVDLLPTLCSIAGVEMDSKFRADGQDITPLLNGGELDDRGTLFWTIQDKKSNGNYGITTDSRPDPIVTQVARRGPWKLLARGGEAAELYNMDEDRYERWNLIKEYPVIARELSEELQQFLSEPRLAKPY